MHEFQLCLFPSSSRIRDTTSSYFARYEDLLLIIFEQLLLITSYEGSSFARRVRISMLREINTKQIFTIKKKFHKKFTICHNEFSTSQ